MNIIDAHCDVLGKLTADNRLSFYKRQDELHVQHAYMETSNIALQVFALFVSPSVPSHHRFHEALRMIDTFYEKVVRVDRLVPVLTSADVEKVLHNKSSLRGGMLALEGADALQGNVLYLRILYQLGLRILGFTWNHRNEAADGVEEPNPGGLSKFGREILREANRLNMLLDVSHMSEKGFWDVLELSEAPVLASHSNCKAVCNHPRNLSDQQLISLFQKGGVVGLTFVPYFVSTKKKVIMEDLFAHLDHVLSLGGEDHIGFGSDFDGVDVTMADLSSAERYYVLAETLLKCYKEEQVNKWLHGNWRRLFTAVLN